MVGLNSLVTMVGYILVSARALLLCLLFLIFSCLLFALSIFIISYVSFHFLFVIRKTWVLRFLRDILILTTASGEFRFVCL